MHFAERLGSQEGDGAGATLAVDMPGLNLNDGVSRPNENRPL